MVLCLSSLLKGGDLSCLALNPQHPATEPIEEMYNQQMNEKREKKSLIEFRAQVLIISPEALFHSCSCTFK